MIWKIFYGTDVYMLKKNNYLSIGIRSLYSVTLAMPVHCDIMEIYICRRCLGDESLYLFAYQSLLQAGVFSH